MARAMIVLRNTCFPPRELGLADRERIAPNTTPPASAGTPPQERRGTKRKRRPVFVLGAASEQQTPRVFLVLLLLLFSLAELADGCELRGEGRQLGFDGRDFLLVLRAAPRFLGALQGLARLGLVH